MALQEQLQDLHAQLAQTMLDELKYYREESIPVPAADKQAVIALLKMNDITCHALDDTAVDNLRAELDKGRQERKSRMKQALQAAGADVIELYK